MSDIFESIEGGSVSSFLAGDGSLPTPTPATPATTEQAQGDGANPHQVEDNATSQTDATIESDKPAGAEEGSVKTEEKSDSPDAQQPKAELDGPKALRTAYENLKAEVAPFEPYKDFIKEVAEKEISPLMLQEGKSLLDNYLSLEDASVADATQFLGGLFQLSPTAFQKAMLTLIDDNKDFVAARLGLASTEADKSVSVDEEIPVPEFDPVTGEPLSEEIQNLIRNASERVKSFNQKEQQRQEADRQAAAEAAAKQQQDREAEIDSDIEKYRTERMAVIDRTIAQNLGLQESPKDSPEVKTEKALLRDIIKGATISSFGADPKSRTLYKQAVDNIAGGKAKLAQGLAFNIENEMGKHATKVAAFISNLYAKAYQKETAQVQQAATGARPEVSDNGANVSAGSVDTTNMKPFSEESINARLAQLEASGRLSPRR